MQINAESTVKATEVVSTIIEEVNVISQTTVSAVADAVKRNRAGKVQCRRTSDLSENLKELLSQFKI